LLLYYRAKGHGPAKIEELTPYAFVGEPLNLNCPTTGKPYLCAPNGLTAPGEKMHIYLYDAEPVHHGERWCVVNNGAIVGAAGFFTVHIPEAKFQLFLQSGTPTTEPRSGGGK
jgi:hypothetical protein